MKYIKNVIDGCRIPLSEIKTWKQKSIVFTHAEDNDGVVSALALQALEESISGIVPAIFPLNYSELHKIPAEGSYYICDLNLKPGHPALENPNAFIVDHHAWETLPTASGIIDPSMCAAKLATLLYVNSTQLVNPVKLAWLTLADTIDAGDRYLSEHPQFNTANVLKSLISLMGFDWISKLFAKDLHWFTRGDELGELFDLAAKMMKRDNEIGMAIAQSTVKECGDYVIAYSPVGDRSTIGVTLATAYDTPAILVLELLTDNGFKTQLAIRDTKGRAVDIARKLGGGGHPNAAGVDCPALCGKTHGTFEEIAEIIKSKLQ